MRALWVSLPRSMATPYPSTGRSHGTTMSPGGQVRRAQPGQTEGVLTEPSARHRRPRAVSWPAALLPGALLVTMLSVGTVGSTSSDVPVTDLHVVNAGER